MLITNATMFDRSSQLNKKMFINTVLAYNTELECKYLCDRLFVRPSVRLVWGHNDNIILILALVDEFGWFINIRDPVYI